MDTKKLLFTGAVVTAASKFYFGNEWKPALILGTIAIVAVALSDNVISN